MIVCFWGPTVENGGYPPKRGSQTIFARNPNHRLGNVASRIFWDPQGGSGGGTPGGYPPPQKSDILPSRSWFIKYFWNTKIFFSKCVSWNYFYKNKNNFVYTFFDQQFCFALRWTRASQSITFLSCWINSTQKKWRTSKCAWPHFSPTWKSAHSTFCTHFFRTHIFNVCFQKVCSSKKWPKSHFFDSGEKFQMKRVIFRHFSCLKNVKMILFCVTNAARPKFFSPKWKKYKNSFNIFYKNKKY